MFSIIIIVVAYFCFGVLLLIPRLLSKMKSVMVSINVYPSRCMYPSVVL